MSEDVVTVATPKSKFEVKVVETIHRTYTVEADDAGKAESRLRVYLNDEGMVAPGVVTSNGEGERVRWQIRRPGSPSPRGQKKS